MAPSVTPASEATSKTMTTKRKTKAVKRWKKAKPVGETMLFNGNAYIVMTVDTLQNGKFEKIKLTAVRYFPLF